MTAGLQLLAFKGHRELQLNSSSQLLEKTQSVPSNLSERGLLEMSIPWPSRVPVQSLLLTILNNTISQPFQQMLSSLTSVRVQQELEALGCVPNGAQQHLCTGT